MQDHDYMMQDLTSMTSAKMHGKAYTVATATTCWMIIGTVPVTTSVEP